MSEKLADTVTDFCGSMWFVYIHAFIFAVWCSTGLFGFDKFPFNFLTMSVSLEAIFLSTFILISQNRSEERDKEEADKDHQVDRKAEQEIEDLQKAHDQTHEKLDELLKRTTTQKR